MSNQTGVAEGVATNQAEPVAGDQSNCPSPGSARRSYALECVVCGRDCRNGKHLFWHLLDVHNLTHKQAGDETRDALNAWKIANYGSDAIISSAGDGPAETSQQGTTSS